MSDDKLPPEGDGDNELDGDDELDSELAGLSSGARAEHLRAMVESREDSNDAAYVERLLAAARELERSPGGATPRRRAARGRCALGAVHVPPEQGARGDR